MKKAARGAGLKQNSVGGDLQELQELREAYKSLEKRLGEQTAALEKANEELQAELARRTRSEEELRLLLAVTREIGTAERVKAENWLDRLIETTQDAVVSIDREGRIVLFNPAAERIFGYTRAEVQRQKVNMLMGEPYRTEHDEYIARYEKTGEARAIGRIRTVTAKRKNGELFPIELSITEIESDETVHYGAFIRDISEKIRLQAQLLESERLAAVGTTAAKIGHELANPVNGMSLTIQLLEQRLAASPAAADTHVSSIVKRLKDEISRLNHLAGEFRTISRREKYEFRPTQLGDLVEDISAIQGPHLAERGIELRGVVPPDLPVIAVDGNKIKQALLNLIKNSAEAMPNGGKITIELSALDDCISVEVADTGVGIPPDVDAFEPFLTTKKEGTGIGLVIVRQIVTAHGGQISYRSRSGEGTTFRIELPRNQPILLNQTLA